VLCLCALLCAASVRAEAAGAATTHTDHPICGANHKDVGDHTSDNCSTPTWTAWNGKSEITYTNNVAYIYLSDDVTLEDAKPLTVSTNQTLYLCLNGHSIKMKYNGGYRVINVESGNLILCDCKGGGTITQDTGNKYKDRGVYVQKKYGETTPGTFTMYGGSITGNAGGVKIDSDCTFTMCSGNITANAVDSDRGGGVNVYNNGTFTMYNGEISHNSAYFGGGVYNGGKFTMSGGSITNNTAKGDGGGVNNDSKFIMSGGKITSNTATGDGGGVYGGLTMSGGSITNNTAKGDGGGVEAVGDAVQITGGEITGNTATNDGGGVCFYNSNLTISSAAKVANNKAAKGGGVFFRGYTASNTLTISDSAQITDNTAAENGGGIYIRQNTNVTFLLSGSINISGNKKSVGENASTPNNVYLPSGYVITLKGELTNTQKIGVTTENTPSESCISITATCYDNELVSAAKDKFAYENDNSYSIVTRSNGKVLAVCDHVYDTTKWSSDETNHYHKCKNCDTTKDTTAHSYSSDWKTDNSKHWHECECGQKSGEAAHSYSTAWKIGDGKHWHECECGQKSGEADHAYSNEWKTGDGKHWHECVCGQKSGEAAHSYSTAWKTGDGKHWHECVCGQKSEEAEHSYSTAWQRDGTSHFHECFCGDKKDITPCVYDRKDASSNYLVSNATCTAKAVYYKSCVCARAGTATFEYGEKNPNNHTGTLGSWQSNDDGHWKEYSCCQAQSDKAAHAWNEGEVTTPATCTTPGERTFTCTVCSATKKETIPATGHAWDTEWSKDNDHHWHKCKNCNAIDESTKAPHSWDNVEVTTSATCTTAGERTYTCTACSATKKETIPATGHAPGAAVCESKVAATCTTAGSYDEVVYCTTCGNEVSRTQKTIDKLAHDYDTTKWVKADENQHGHKCKNCDAITDLTAHVPGAAATETTPQLCTECGYVIAPATHPTHTWVFVAETPATCNAAGEREHYKCTCGRTSFKNGDAYDINEDASVLTIEKNSANHTGAPDSKWHSDSANHWQEYTCCHARANEAAHSGGAATCTAQAVCEVCGKAYGPLAAHDWGAWKVTTPATKDAPGVETRTCAHNSAHTETRSIPKLSTTVYTVSEDTKIAQIEAKVDGLDKILELNENKALVNDGKSVGVSLTVKNTASSGVSEKIKEKLAGSNLVGLRLELTVEKTVTANGVVESKQTIPDAGVLLKTTITLPAELQGKSGYVVYRLHDENVHVLTETPNENGEFITVSADKTQITICARLYSEYVIAYQTGGSSGR